jgi:hypothetical protein
VRILVITPTLDRAHKMRPHAENVRAATTVATQVLFVLEEGDYLSLQTAKELAREGIAGWVINERKHNFTGALNHGYALAAHSGTDFTHIFNGSDDIWFSDDWDTPALKVLETYPQLRVAGTNDLHNGSVLGGHTATSYLTDRRYIDEVGGVIDELPGIVQCEAYDHNYTDTEYIDTAKYRGVFKPCLESVVEHRHPVWGMAQMDGGYQKSMSGMAADGVIYASRRHLWGFG